MGSKRDARSIYWSVIIFSHILCGTLAPIGFDFL